MGAKYGVTYVEAKHDLVVDVTAEDLKTAIPGQKNFCVLAEACKRDSKVGLRLIALEVGASITKLIYQNSRTIKIVRYITDTKARQCLLHWDTTGEWTLPLGWTLLGRKMNKNNSLKNERKRVVDARKEGKCFENGSRSAQGLPKRVAGRRIPARQVNFLQRAGSIDFAVRQIVTGANTAGAAL